jgi:hypothetical protein
MSNLTFDEKLVREHTAEPLEGHTVVVMERSGASGEKFYSLLEPGDDGPRRGLIDFLRGKPSVYFAFAVDASRHRLLSFSADVAMAEHAHSFELHFSLWYRVSDAQLLVCTRAGDPLKLLRAKVIEELTVEMAELSWADVWHSFRVVSDRVVAATLPAIKSIARDYGIAINSLRLKATFPEKAIAAEREIEELRQQGRVDREKSEIVREQRNHELMTRQEDAGLEEKDRALTALEKQQDRAAEVTTEGYVKRLEAREQGRLDREQAEIARERRTRGWGTRQEDAALEEADRALTAARKQHDRLNDATLEAQVRFIGEASSADELVDNFSALEGASPPVYGTLAHNGNGAHAIRPGPSVSPLPPDGTGLSAVLADLLTHTDFRPDLQCRRVRGLLLHVVAAAVADDSLSAELVDHARRARVEIDAATNVPTRRAEALLALADPQQLRQRLYPQPVA